MARPLSITLEIEANELRRRIALGDTAPVDTRKALQQLGVLCVFMPMQETFSGMCLKHKEKRFMLVNSKVALGRQHFTIAHELYHLFIQEEFSSQICPQSSSDPVEKQADCFATFFLMPRKVQKTWNEIYCRCQYSSRSLPTTIFRSFIPVNDLSSKQLDPDFRQAERNFFTIPTNRCCKGVWI